MFDDAGLIEETPAGGRKFSSPKAAAADVAGMGIKNGVFLKGLNRHPDAIVLSEMPMSSKRRLRSTASKDAETGAEPEQSID